MRTGFFWIDNKENRTGSRRQFGARSINEALALHLDEFEKNGICS
jgi:hypothetical protein